LNRKVVVVATIILLISLTLGCIEIEDVTSTTKDIINTTQGFVGDITIKTKEQYEPNPSDVCKEAVHAQMREDEKRMPVGIKYMEIVEIKKFNNSEVAASYIGSYPLGFLWRSEFKRVVENEEVFYVAIGRFDFEQPLFIEGSSLNRVFGVYVCNPNGTLIYHRRP